jgi:hypothetical protein
MSCLNKSLEVSCPLTTLYELQVYLTSNNVSLLLRKVKLMKTTKNEMTVTYLKDPSRHLPGTTQEKHD